MSFENKVSKSSKRLEVGEIVGGVRRPSTNAWKSLSSGKPESSSGVSTVGVVGFVLKNSAGRSKGSRRRWMASKVSTGFSDTETFSAAGSFKVSELKNSGVDRVFNRCRQGIQGVDRVFNHSDVLGGGLVTGSFILQLELRVSEEPCFL